MKSTAKVVVASAVVIALCLCAVSGVTYSWFTDTEEAEINITTGVVNVEQTITNTTHNVNEIIGEGGITIDPSEAIDMNKNFSNVVSSKSTVGTYVTQIMTITVKFDKVSSDIPVTERLSDFRENFDVKVNGQTQEINYTTDMEGESATEATGIVYLLKWTAVNPMDGNVPVSVPVPAKFNLSFDNTNSTKAQGLAINVKIETNAVQQGSALDWQGEITEPEIDTTEKKITISNVSDLAWFQSELNSKTNGDKSYDGYTVELTADLDLGGQLWTPMITWANNLTFEGKKTTGGVEDSDPTITISNLKIFRAPFSAGSMNVGGSYGAGLIGDAAAPLTFKNIKMTNVDITDSLNETENPYNPASSQHYAGALVGHTNSTVTCENITLENSKIRNSWQCGGLIGYGSTNIEFSSCNVSNTFVGGKNATSGILFGLGYADVTITDCESTNVKLYTDSDTWDSDGTDYSYWIGDVYNHTITVNSSTTSGTEIVSTYPNESTA